MRDGKSFAMQSPIYFPVRHNSPACAFHATQLIRHIKPQVVLIQAPRDATRFIPLLTGPGTRMPVALYASFIERFSSQGGALHHSGFLPLCDYSPEIAALRAAQEVGAQVRFIDLTFPEQVASRAYRGLGPASSRNLLEEKHLRRSAGLAQAARACGARNLDDLWDHLYETGFEVIETTVFMRNVMAYYALARRDQSPQLLAAEGSLAREQAMAHEIAQSEGLLTVVITGGIHGVALPETTPRAAAPVHFHNADAQLALVPFGFQQLDRLASRESGMPSPEFYQRRWEGRQPGQFLVRLGKILRQRGLQSISAEQGDTMSTLRKLARDRGHFSPSREDLLDAVRSQLLQGGPQQDGFRVLALARRLLTGQRVGMVPPETELPSLVGEVRATATRLGVFEKAEELILDPHGNPKHRELTQFFSRLRFLAVKLGRCTARSASRSTEVWRYRWTSQVELALVEASRYGSTLEEAARALLLSEEKEAGNRTRLLVEAGRMGLGPN